MGQPGESTLRLCSGVLLTHVRVKGKSYGDKRRGLIQLSVCPNFTFTYLSDLTHYFRGIANRRVIIYFIL